MADYGPVKLREKQIKALIEFYKQSARKITQDIITASEGQKINLARTMVRINRELEALGVKGDEWLRRELPQYYNDGGNIALQDLRKLGVDLDSTGLVALDKEAIQALVDDATGSYQSAIQGISRSARSILSEVVRQQVSLTIAEGRLTGEARKTISARVAQRLSEGGLKAITDRAGKQWSLDSYSSMLVRTKAVEARNQGLANKMLSYGYDLVQVSNHNSDHKACKAWEGKILSLTGMTEGYPTLEQAKASGLFHPNCEHAINVINLELAQKTKIYDNPFNRT